MYSLKTPQRHLLFPLRPRLSRAQKHSPLYCMLTPFREPSWGPRVMSSCLFLPCNVMCVSHSVVSDSCDPMDCSPPDSSVHGILQARILEWIAISFSRGSSQPRDRTHISCVGRQILYCWATRKVLAIMSRDWINIYWINDLKWLISILFLCLSEVNFKYRIISVVPLTMTNLSSSRVLDPS